MLTIGFGTVVHDSGYLLGEIFQPGFVHVWFVTSWQKRSVERHLANTRKQHRVCWCVLAQCAQIPVILRHQNWHQKLPGNYTRRAIPSDKWYVMDQGKAKTYLVAALAVVRSVKNRAQNVNRSARSLSVAPGAFRLRDDLYQCHPHPKLSEKLLW